MNAETKEEHFLPGAVVIQPPTLLQRIVAVRSEPDVGYIQKDKNVSAGAGGSYKAVTHDMVTAVLRAALNKHGIVVIPNLVSSRMAEQEFDKDGKPKAQRRYECTYDFTFFNVDDKTDALNARIDAHAMDNGDKAPGKGLSYAKKYAMLKVFEIETGEDEESRVDDYAIDELVANLQKAESYEDGLALYQDYFNLMTVHKDKDGLAVMRSVWAKTKEKFGKGDYTPKERPGEQPAQPEAGTDKPAEKEAPQAKPDAQEKSAPSAKAEKKAEQKAEKPAEAPSGPAPTGDLVTQGEAAFLRKKADAAQQAEAALCAKFGVSGDTFEQATKEQWAAIKKFIQEV